MKNDPASIQDAGTIYQDEAFATTDDGYELADKVHNRTDAPN